MVAVKVGLQVIDLQQRGQDGLRKAPLPKAATMRGKGLNEIFLPVGPGPPKGGRPHISLFVVDGF
jgi:hypothetical protein